MRSVGLIFLLFNFLWAIDINLELDNASSEYISETYRKALTAFLEKNYLESLKYIRHVIKSNFQDYRLRLLAGYCHWNLGNFEPAIIHFSKLEEIEPENPTSYTELAALYLSQNEYIKAEQILRKGLRKIPVEGNKIPPRLYNLLTRSLLLQNKIKEAFSFVQKAKAVYSSAHNSPKERVESLALEGRILTLEQKEDKAVFLLDWAISLDSQDPYLWNLLGVNFLLWSKKLGLPESEEKKQKAKEAFDKAISLNPPQNLLLVIEQNKKSLNP